MKSRAVLAYCCASFMLSLNLFAADPATPVLAQTVAPLPLSEPETPDFDSWVRKYSHPQTRTLATNATSPRVTTNVLTDGSAGDIFLTAPSPFTDAGVLLRPTTGAPAVSVQLASPSTSQFRVYDSSGSLFYYADPVQGSVFSNTLGPALTVYQGTATNKDILRAFGGHTNTPIMRLTNTDGTNYAAFLRMNRETWNAMTSTWVPEERILLSGSTNYTSYFLGTLAVGKNTVGTGFAVDVAGTLHATAVSADTVTATNGINAVYQDVAEWVPASEKLDAGTVVVVSPDVSNEITPSSRVYQTSVAGVVSDKPGVLLGVGADTKAKIATTGRVKVKVDASGGAIRPGDLLVTSGKRGVAMKSRPISVGGVEIHRPGTLVGKALEPLESGEGEILVLLSLQ
jgi:hypothetical protein